MAKVKGYIQARAPQIADLRAGKTVNTKFNEREIKDEQRNVAVALLDDKRKRKVSKTEQRNNDREIMAKSLVNYPKNPVPRAGIWNAADHVRSAPKSEAGKPRKGKRVDANNDVHPRIAKANRKQAQVAARQLAKEERKQAKALRKEQRIAARAERASTREARKAERAEARRLSNMPTIAVSNVMMDNVLDVVQGQFSLTDKQRVRQGKILARLAKVAPKKLHNRSKQLEIRIALLQGLKLEIDAEAKRQADAEAAGLDAQEWTKETTPKATKPAKKKVAKKAKPEPKVIAKPKSKKRVSFK